MMNGIPHTIDRTETVSETDLIKRARQGDEGAMEALYALAASARKAGLRRETALFVELRASQINGCSFCVDMHSRELKEMDVSDERIWGVGAWRESPYFTDAERAALALTEALTRIADKPDPVPDEVWDEEYKDKNARRIKSARYA